MSGVKGQMSGGNGRISIAEHRRRGTFRNDRHIPAVAAPAVVMSEDPPPSPEGLSESSANLWGRILAEYALTSVPSLELLECALRNRDVAEAARRTMEREGLTYRGADGAPRAHPAAVIHRDARAAFVTTLRVLGFPEEAQS